MRLTRGFLMGLVFVVAYLVVTMVVWPAIQVWWQTRKIDSTGSGGIGFVITTFDVSLLRVLIAFALGFAWQWFR